MKMLILFRRTKRLLFTWVLACLLPLMTWANVWQDPDTKVNYEYTPGKTEASVMAGENNAGMYTSGSPDVSGDITILSSFTVDGNIYSVTSIGDDAFACCSTMTSISIPSSITKIWTTVFRSCDALESIFIDTGNTVYDSRDNCNAIVETSTNTLIAGCKNTAIPNSITSIGHGAFEECWGLKSITIRNSRI